MFEDLFDGVDLDNLNGRHINHAAWRIIRAKMCRMGYCLDELVTRLEQCVRQQYQYNGCELRLILATALHAYVTSDLPTRLRATQAYFAWCADQDGFKRAMDKLFPEGEPAEK